MKRVPALLFRSAVLLIALAALAAASMPTQAVAGAQSDPCLDDGDAATPTAVAVEAVPIQVESTTAEYFVLYVRHDLNADTTVEVPVLVKQGSAGITTLAENVAGLPKERYRVEKYLVAVPADVDVDCIDDLTDANPVNPAAAPELREGAAAVPDRATFETLSHAQRDLKFILLDLGTDRPSVY